MRASTKRVTGLILATLGSLLLGACDSKAPKKSTGAQTDELATPDVSSETDSPGPTPDVQAGLPDVAASADSGGGTDTAQAIDAAMFPETVAPPEVKTTDAPTDADDGCPVWVPVDEPDYGKPPQPPSSLSACTAELPCPEGETCSLDFYLVETATTGACYRPCYHPKSDFPNDLGCDPSQYCALASRCLSSHPDPDCDPETGRNMQSVGWCGPKNRTQGGAGGTWDSSGCPCEHPTLTEAEKAACEAGAE